MEHEKYGAKGIEALVKIVVSIVDVVAEVTEYGRNYHHTRLCDQQEQRM